MHDGFGPPGTSLFRALRWKRHATPERAIMLSITRSRPWRRLGANDAVNDCGVVLRSKAAQFPFLPVNSIACLTSETLSQST